jgi:hypothetical protein
MKPFFGIMEKSEFLFCVCASGDFTCIRDLNLPENDERQKERYHGY